ncbi:uncharacterized protein LOC122633525 isoform X1 [Vespula pensylvanica]|uniref:uncharacterized protein LOC122633525 isoform X1 n=1 Tax=Vespula pensylvanica TaxID=30213 RepID=UPI001CBA495E|nr:uncharacterized protein LOC122633525 isoform X1 [Vespula pensylvanica]
MYFVLQLFNSIIFFLINLTIVLYTLQRFFWAMKQHYKIVTDIADFNSMVNESRASLDYMKYKIMEAMDEIKEDVSKELCITDRLTKLSSRMAALSQRFNIVEEGVIEFVRMDHNMESVRVETPANINEEMDKILTNLVEKKQQRGKH